MSAGAALRREKPARKATYKDVLDAPAHMVAEIVDGVLHLQRRPPTLAALAKTALASELGGPFFKGRDGPGGWWIVNEPELHFGEDIVVPDIAGWRREPMPTVPDVAFFDPGARLDLRSPFRFDAEAGRRSKAPGLCAGGRRPPVVRRSGGADAGGVRAARRRVDAGRGRRGRTNRCPFRPSRPSPSRSARSGPDAGRLLRRPLPECSCHSAS